MSIEVEPNKYIMRMWSDIKARQLDEYEVYAYSEEEAIQKLSAGDHQGMVTPIETEFTDHISDCPETIEIVSCEEGTIS